MDTPTLQRTTDDVLRRVRMEFIEMPGLVLTSEQARRLWNMNAPECQAILASLVAESFLSVSRAGTYRRQSHV